MSDREQWLQARRAGLGSSDAAAVCGLSPWKTPLHVYLDKTDTGPVVDDAPDGGPLYWGTRLEPLIVEEYERRTGLEVRKATYRIVRHPSVEWLCSSPDAEAGEDVVVEVKTAAMRKGWGEPNTDQVPEHYLVQGLHHLAANPRLARCDFAVLFHGSDFQVYTVARSPHVESHLLRIERDFWESNVRRRVPPPPDWSHPDTPALVRALGRPAVEVELGPDLAAMAREYKALGAEAGAIEKRREEIKARLQQGIGTPGVGRFPGGSVTWKPVTVNYKPKPASVSVQDRVQVKLEGQSDE